jgi:hypothetical protein
MVIQIQGKTSCGEVHLFRNRHARQHDRILRVEQSVLASNYHRAELSSTLSIEVDEPLLTGNLDEDISILDIVA